MWLFRRVDQQEIDFASPIYTAALDTKKIMAFPTMVEHRDHSICHTILLWLYPPVSTSVSLIPLYIIFIIYIYVKEFIIFNGILSWKYEMFATLPAEKKIADVSFFE